MYGNKDSNITVGDKVEGGQVGIGMASLSISRNIDGVVRVDVFVVN